MSKKNIGFIILGVIILSLIIFRIYLPTLVTNRVNERLSQLEGYEGSISGVDLHLYRGAGKVFDINIDKFNENQPKPFIEIPEYEFSVEWKSLWKGSIVGEMTLKSPSMNIEIEESGKAEQTGKEIDWVDLVQDLTPIRINTFRIIDANVEVDFPESEAPQFDFDMDDIDVLITNITNVEDHSKALPSDIKITSKLKNYSGDLDVTASANMLKKVPDMDMNLKLESLNLENFNPFLKHYVGIDFSSGQLNFYSEIALKDKEYKGYLKPSLQDPEFFKANEEDRNLWQAAKELAAEGLQELFENQKKEQTATRIPISGTLEQTNVNYWQAFIVGIRNAYIDALKNNLDNTVAFSDLNNS